MTSLLNSLLNSRRTRPFALLRREDGTVDVLAGHTTTVASIADIPVRNDHGSGPDVLAAIPFRQICERGFECHDDGAPLTCLVVDDHENLQLTMVLAAIADRDLEIGSGRFEPDDDTYGSIVDEIVRDEIGSGAGANFVIRRDFLTTTRCDHTDAALVLFRRLLERERGAYWTFAFVTADMALVGATPERHVSAHACTVLMNPISGTYRHRIDGPTEHGLLEFLGNAKETDELFMVVDEELKMMSDVCELGGRVIGPFLKEMEHLTHTEYLLEGRTTLDVREILRKTMFAPTVTGSPIENAAAVITRYESTGRGYYSGVLALIGHDEAGRQTLDAPIVIRTCEISASGTIKASVGATLVRGSIGTDEVSETHAKLGGLLAAMHSAPHHKPRPRRLSLAENSAVADALSQRNRTLARFWIEQQKPAATGSAETLASKKVVIINLEDEWTAMLGHQLRYLGMQVEIQRWEHLDIPTDVDLVVAGPGPGDPRDRSDPRIATVEAVLTARIRDDLPTLAICLSHQVLAQLLGYPLRPLQSPSQGTQKSIDFFGQTHDVGFYNTFAGYEVSPALGIETSTGADGVIHGLRGPSFASVQFHPESILTTHGLDILEDLVLGVFSVAADVPANATA